MYAPTARCDEEEINILYDILDVAKQHCKLQEVFITMGDQNSKDGERKYNDIVGIHSLGLRDERGQKWLYWCAANSQIITNTWLKEHSHQK